MNGYCDFHIHSALSLDGVDDLLSQVRASREKGVRTICFTEHIDLDTEEGDFLVDFDAYRAQMEQARAAFPDVKLLAGLELGDENEARERVIAYANAMELDYKLLSRHRVGGVDPYFGEKFFLNRTRQQALEDYLDAVIESIVAFPDYDGLSHLGYVFKFVQSDTFPPLRYGDAPDKIDYILKYLIEHGKALEMNTARWNKSGDGMPTRSIFARYRALGGELVTLGSDAHRNDAVAQGFAPACELLRDLGFTALTTFEKRKPVMLKL